MSSWLTFFREATDETYATNASEKKRRTFVFNSIFVIKLRKNIKYLFLMTFNINLFFIGNLDLPKPKKWNYLTPNQFYYKTKIVVDRVVS